MMKKIDKKGLATRNKLICKLYDDGYSSVEIENIVNLCNTTILKILKKNNIKIRNRHECQYIHDVNRKYFDCIDSHDKAYWIGFIAGDGLVHNNTVSITLSIQDKIILENFKKCIDATQPILEFKSHKKSFAPNNNYCNINITSYELINQLKKYGIIEKKSKIFSIKNIPEQFISSFILGLIDADGCFRISAKGQISLSLVGSRTSMIQIQKILIKNCNLNKTKLINHHTTPEICYLEYAGNKQMQKIFHFLYDNMSPIFLKRKYDRIIQCFK